MKTWRKPDTNEDPFDLSLESLLQRAEEAEERNFEDMQELLFQIEKMERKEGWKRKTSDKKQAFHIRSVFQKARSGQKNVRKILLAMGLCLVIGVVSGGIEANGGFQVGLWMQNRHGVSYLKGEMADRYESNDINKKLQEISETLDTALLQFKTEGKESVVCTGIEYEKDNDLARVDMRIGYETYHVEYVKAKENTSYTLSENLKIVEEIQIGEDQIATVCTWTDEDRDKYYYAYIIDGATVITIGTGTSIQKFRKMLQMLILE